MRRSHVALLALAFLISAPLCAQQSESSPSPPSSVPASPAKANPQNAVSPGEQSVTTRQQAEMRGDIDMARKMYPEAIQEYKRLLNKTPKDTDLLKKIGVAYQQQGEMGQAARFYKRAIKADKTDAAAINNLGTIEYQRRHYRKSIRLYDKALAVRKEATFYSNLGYAYFADKQYAQAIVSLRQALELDPAIFQGHSGYGSVIQQRSVSDPGMFYFLVAKSYAVSGDAGRCAHFLKMARDEGYKQYTSAQSDPAFAGVIKDPRVQEVLHPEEALPDEGEKGTS